MQSVHHELSLASIGRQSGKRLGIAAILASALVAPNVSGAAAETDWSKVATALGKSGTEMAGGVYRVGLPRTDLHVTLDGVELKSTFALGSWLAFRPEGNMTMVMGDLVLTETEIAPVMTKLAEGGIAITALHNHLLRAQPATFYMHVFGQGIRSSWPQRCMAASRSARRPLARQAVALPARHHRRSTSIRR